MVHQVSYYDLKEGTYYVSVLCGPTSTSFRIKAFLTPALLHAGGSTLESEACEGNLIYHKFDTGAGDYGKTAHITLDTRGADKVRDDTRLYVLACYHHRMQHIQCIHT